MHSKFKVVHYLNCHRYVNRSEKKSLFTGLIYYFTLSIPQECNFHNCVSHQYLIRYVGDIIVYVFLYKLLCFHKIISQSSQQHRVQQYYIHKYPFEMNITVVSTDGLATLLLHIGIHKYISNL